MHIGLIVKVSKLCNMRCTYCCEGPELANPARMDVADIETVFGRLAEFLRCEGDSGRHKLTFYWHGGEPFAQPIAYWEAILAAQDRVFAQFGRRIRILNAVQSNLTLLTERHLPLLLRFRLGFSFDVVNRLRVMAGGQDSTARVIEKIDWLMAAGVPLAGIVVVSAANVEHARTVASFYLDRQLPLRFIQLDEGLEHVPTIYADRVAFDRYLGFARALWDDDRVREAMERGWRVDPLTLAAQALAKCERRPVLSMDDCAEREHLLEIDTDGAVYSTADYPLRNSYGNIFDVSIETLLLSEARQLRIAESRRRLGEVCSGCALFRRGCNGVWVAHATRPQYEEFCAHGGCELHAIAGWMRSVSFADDEQVVHAGYQLS